MQMFGTIFKGKWNIIKMNFSSSDFGMSIPKVKLRRRFSYL